MICRLYIALILCSVAAFGRARTDGWCQQGNTQVTLAGTGVTATPKVQGSFPTCTVTVYQAGTLTLASIYSDNNGTAKSNPFTLTLGSNGYWVFYADDGKYDIATSGGGLSGTATQGDRPSMDPLFTPLTNSGTATARPYQTKVSEQLSVKDYGAIGDGVADDAPAFNRAVTAAVARSGATIWVPCGNYKWNSTVTISQFNVSLIGENPNCVNFRRGSANTMLIIQMNPFNTVANGEYSNFNIVGTSTANGIGLRTGCLVGAQFKNITVDGFTGTNSIGIDVQDRLDCNPGQGGGWTERTTWTNVWGGGTGQGNNTVSWKFELQGGPTNISFGYNHFINVSANASPGQTGFWFAAGIYMYNSDFTATCNLDDTGGWTGVSPICVLVDGNVAQNVYHVTGEYGGTHTAISVKTNSGAGFWGYGVVTIFDKVGAIIPWTVASTGAQSPTARVTAYPGNQSPDSGSMTLEGVSAVANIIAADPSGTVNFGYAAGTNRTSPMISMGSATGNHFMVCQLPAATALTQCNNPTNDVFDVSSSGVVQIRGNQNHFVGTSPTPLQVGGVTQASTAGYTDLLLAVNSNPSAGPAFINETISLSGANVAGFGDLDGVNIAHPMAWGYLGDPNIFEWYTKPLGSAITAANRIAGVALDGSFDTRGHMNQNSGRNNIASSCNTAGTQTCTWTFTTAFNSVPICTVTPISDLGAGVRYWLSTVSKNGCVVSTSAPVTVTFHLIAIGNPN